MRVPVVFDNLIAKHDLPPMIGIFVDPGILPVVSDADQNRYNRIYEYDSLTPRFSRVSDRRADSRGRAKNYNLSKNPDDRGLSGVSTGAVGAFAAAWNRPDQFHRVLSFIGTYVSMKGADALPALVRKTEPKPIRIWMQDGTQDHIVAPEPFGSSPFGSWPINNQVMYEALEFAGYDVKFEMGTEAHNMKQGGADLPDALRWLWRGYPEPIVVHEPAAAHEPGYDTTNRVFSTIYLDKPWEQIGGEYSPITSLTSDAAGNVYFPDGGAIDRIGPDGKVLALFSEPPNDSAIVRMGPNGRLYTWQQSTGDIVSSNTATGTATDQKTVARHLPTLRDFVVTQNGTIYFLDGGYFTIGLVDASGEPKVLLHLKDLGSGIITPGGLGLSPDQSMLEMSDSISRYSWSLQIAADGSLINGEPFYRLEIPETDTLGWQVLSGPGVVEDADGAVYFATQLGIQIFMQNGRVMQILSPPAPDRGPLNAITFAGTGGARWIYVAQGFKLYRRPVKVTGANAWTLVKPPKPTL